MQLRCAFLAASLILPLDAGAQELEQLEAEIAPAFDGWTRYEGRTAVALDVLNRGKDWQGKLQMLEEGSRLERPLELPSGSRKRIWVPVQLRPGGMEGRFLHLESKGGETLSTRYALRALGPHDVLAAVVSDRGMFLSGLVRATSPTGPGTIRAPYLNSKELPAHPQAYGAVDALFAADWRPEALTSEQAQALKSWVADGGLLVLSADPDPAKLRTEWLAPILPAKQGPDAELKVVAALARHTGVPGDPRDPEPWSVKLEPDAGATVLLGSEREPLAVLRPFGRGAVCLTAFNLSDRSLGAYDGWTLFLLELLGMRLAPANPGEQYTLPTAMTQILDRSLRDFSVSGTQTTGLFAGFAVVYLLVLVPGNYFYLRRIGRLERYWQAMLSVVGVFALLGWGMGAIGRGGDSARTLYVVESGPGLGLSRVTAFAGILSSKRRVRSFSFSGDLEAGGEIFTEQHQYAGRPADGRGWSLARGERASELKLPLEIGELRFFRLTGTRNSGDGMHFRWKEDASQPELEWENRTGTSYEKLVLLLTPHSFAGTAIAAPAGASGLLPAPSSAKGGAPIEALLGPELAKDYGELVKAYLSQPKIWEGMLLLGIPKPSSAGGRRAAPFCEIHLWPVPAKSNLPFLARRYLDVQPARRNWYLSGSELVLQSGEVVLEDFVPGFSRLADPPQAPADRGALFRIRGNWVKEPELEAFDFSAGRWETLSKEKTLTLEPSLNLGEASQARLALNSGGLLRAVRTTPAGAIFVDYLEYEHLGGKASRFGLSQLRAAGVDPLDPPAIAIDALHRTHVVFRAGGKLHHAREEVPRKWRVTAIDGSEGGRRPALAAGGTTLHLAFTDAARGVFYALHSGAAWSVSPVLARAGVSPPVAVDAGPSSGVRVLYHAGSELVLSTQRGARWDAEVVESLSVPSSLGLGSSAGQTHVVALVAGGLPGGETLFRAIRHERSHYSMAWARNSTLIHGGAFAAAVAPEPGRYPLTAYFTKSGQIRVLDERSVSIPVAAAGSRPPFDFVSRQASGESFWIAGSGGGLLLSRIKENLTPPTVRPGGSSPDIVITAERAARFAWKPASSARLRLKSSSPVKIHQVEVRLLP